MDGAGNGFDTGRTGESNARALCDVGLASDLCSNVSVDLAGRIVGAGVAAVAGAVAGRTGNFDFNRGSVIRGRRETAVLGVCIDGILLMGVVGRDGVAAVAIRDLGVCSRLTGIAFATTGCDGSGICIAS